MSAGSDTLVLRPARPADLGALVRLAESAGTGLTTLPASREALAARIDRSAAAFAAADIAEPGPESYLLVAEDTADGAVVGTTGLFAAVGLENGFFNYRIVRLTKTSRELGVRLDTRLLTLVNDFTGATEVGTLFLAPGHRRGGNGQLLARSRYLMLAEFPDRFAATVLAEIRGWLRDDHASPFWDAIGRHFFRMPFPEADLLSGLGHARFIADLMPRYPIYIDLLPPEAQAVIGKPHDRAQPALALLLREGFRFNQTIDIFDGGPVVEARRDDIRTVRDSAAVTVDRIAPAADGPPTHIACTTRLGDLRVARVRARRDGGGVIIDAAAARRLGAVPGDRLRLAPLDGGPP
ncbi:arginine N-succinyltransferase [Azospirillum halopraeferens]|uniref:arginine N-succinyltransferase n=1 Tax=Azospirillum halopraeferens TaxID=34010 RepID=UPI000421B623|nr:arginine N-succinyltransferase [Azospirillum halopraeferens]